jgi:hypothetical protein
MPRKPKEPEAVSVDASARLPVTEATRAVDDDGSFTPRAQKLWDQTYSQWNLSPVVEALLDLACRALSRADRCDEILGREGLTVIDSKGTPRPHPLALLSRDLRGQAGCLCQKILTNVQ